MRGWAGVSSRWLAIHAGFFMATRSRSGRMLRSRPQADSRRSVERLWGRLVGFVWAARRWLRRRRPCAGAAAVGAATDARRGGGGAGARFDRHERVRAGGAHFDGDRCFAGRRSGGCRTAAGRHGQHAAVERADRAVGTIDENGTATLSLSFDDPDVGDLHTVEIDWGDGRPIEMLNVPTGVAVPRRRTSTPTTIPRHAGGR